MGRYTTESVRRIELPWLKARGFLSIGSSVGGNLQWSSNGEPTGDIRIFVDTHDDRPYLQMMYKTREHGADDDAWRDYDYKFPLERTPCRYGGYKWFVRCQLSKNGIYCGRRVRILYSAGNYFGCRNCANLTYESCNQSGRYKGFLSIPDLDEQEAKVKRAYYAGKPTKQYRKFLKMNEQFENSFITQALWSKARTKR